MKTGDRPELGGRKSEEEGVCFFFPSVDILEDVL